MKWLSLLGGLAGTVVIVIGAIIYFSNQDRGTPTDTTGDCATPPQFTHHFTDPAAITSIIPPVFRNSKETLPTTLINTQGKVPLYMPASGKLTQGSYYAEQGSAFYMWDIDVGCGVTVTFDHVTEPVEKIRRLFPDIPASDSRSDNPYFATPLEMAAGELVGYTTGTVNAHNWNFAVYDAAEKNYLWDAGTFNDRPKYYTQVCPLKYYNQLMAEAYEKLFVLSLRDLSVEKNLCQ